MAKTSGPTAEIYTTTPGDSRQIGRYGVATNDSPAVVPAEVAAEFDRLDGYRVVTGSSKSPKGEALEAIQEPAPRKKARKGEEE